MTSYDWSTTGNDQYRTWSVEGTGIDGTPSTLDLSSLTWIRGSGSFGNRLTATASAGGHLDLSSVEQIVDQIGGDTRQRRFTFTADGEGSLVSLDALQNLIDRDSNQNSGWNSGLHSTLNEVNGGELVAPALESLINVQYTSEAGSGTINASGAGDRTGLSGFDALEVAANAAAVTGPTVTWIGGDGDWNTASSWSTGVVPTADDHVLLDTAGVTVTISSGARIVRSVNGPGSLRITGGSLTVTESSQIDGALTVGVAATLAVSGEDADFLANGATTINGANLTAVWGGTLRLPNATTYAHGSTGNNQTRTWHVEGNDSRIELGGLTTLTGGTHFDSRLNLNLYDGGQLLLPALTSIEDGASGDTRQRAVSILAEGDGSRFSAPLLSSFTDNDSNPNSGWNAGLHASMTARQGGEISVPALTSLTGVSVNRDGVSTFPLSQLTTVVRATFTVSGVPLDLAALTTATVTSFYSESASIELPALTTLERGSIVLRGRASANVPLLNSVDGSSFEVTGGASLALPGITSYDFLSTGDNQYRYFRADGHGSVLSLPDLETITGGTHFESDFDIVATTGGTIDLGSLTSIRDGEGGDTRQRSVRVISEGFESQIRLDALTTFQDSNVAPNSGWNQGEYSILRARFWGEIVAPSLTTLQGVAVTIDGLGQLPTAQVQELTRSQVNLTGAAFDFSGLTTVDSTSIGVTHAAVDASALTAMTRGSLTLRGGATVDLSAVTDVDGMSFDVNDGVTLDLANVTTYEHLGPGNDVHRTWTVRGSGSRINLSGLTTITGGTFFNDQLVIQAYSGGQMDLSGVTEIVEADSGDTRQRAVRIRSQHEGSLVDLRSLQTFDDANIAPNSGWNAGRYSELIASLGGSIRLDSISRLAGVSVSTSSLDDLSLANLTEIYSSQVTVTGKTLDLTSLTTADATTVNARDAIVDLGTLPTFTRGTFRLEGNSSVQAPALANIDGTSLYVADGGSLQLPLVTSYAHASSGNDQNRYFRAEGLGSSISLPALTAITGGTHFGSRTIVEARTGASVAFPALETIDEETTGDTRQRALFFYSDGHGSEIRLPALRFFNDLNQSRNSGWNEGRFSALHATRGGQVLATALTTANGVDFYADEASTLAVGQFEQVTNSIINLNQNSAIEFTDLTTATGTRILLSGQQASFPQLTTLARGELTLTDGATADVPSLVNIDSATLIVTEGVTLALPAVTGIKHASTGNSQRATLRAEGTGSRLDLSNVESIFGGEHYDSTMAIEAFSGATVDLSGTRSMGELVSGDQRYRRISLLSEGVSSLIDLSSLVFFSDAHSGSNSGSNRFSLVQARYGGAIEFPETRQGGSILQIRARGDEGGEMFDLVIDGAVVATHTVTTSYQYFTYDAADIVAADDVQIHFTNDAVGPNRFDMNLVVDFLTIDGHFFQTEDPSTYSTGTWIGGSVTPGFHRSEILHANGYFQYAGEAIDSATNLWGVYATAGLNGEIRGDVFLDRTSQLTGNGTFAGTLGVAGVVTPNRRLEIQGDLNLTPGGVLDFGIAGLVPAVDHDVIDVSGNVDFNGTVRIVRENNLVPTDGDSYLTMTFGSRSNSQPTYEGLDFGGSALISPELSPTTLEFVTGFSSGGSVTELIASDSAVDADGPFIRVTFSEAIDPAQFTAADVALTGPNGTVGFAGPTPVAGTDDSFLIRPNQSEYGDGEYTVVIGPDVLDFVGNPMNQDGDVINGEPLEDQFVGTVTLALPDLIVPAGTLLSDATEYTFGQSLTLDWRVTNDGASPAAGSTWKDAVYLSSDPALDGNDIFLGDFANDTELAPAEFYDRSEQVQLPLVDGLEAGTYYLLVRVDSAGQIGESDEANVFASEALQITFPPLVDLLPTSVSGPSDGQPRQQHTFTWTVTNQGDEATATTWYDRLYLSSNGSLSGATILGHVWQNGPLAPGESYTSTLTTTLPNLADGEYQLIVVADVAGRVFEGPYEGNNTLAGDRINFTHPDVVIRDLVAPAAANSGSQISVDWEFLNSGTGTANAWQQRIYLSDDSVVSSGDRLIDEFTLDTPLAPGETSAQSRTLTVPVDLQGAKFLLVVTDTQDQLGELSNGEANNVASQLIDLTLSPYADLAVSNVQAPELTIGDPADFTVSWTVTNEGIGAGLVDEWTDAVVLSPNGVAGDGDDIVIASFEHQGGLDQGESYTRNESFKLPPATNGRFTLFIRSDFGKVVFENGFEANNDVSRTGQIDIMPAPNADLIVEQIEVTPPIFAGQTLSATWTVRNQGIGITNRGDWFDRAYLATDPAGQNEIDGTARRFQHFGQVAAGETYQRTGEIQVPDGLQGDYYLVVETAERNGPFEFIYTDNNTTVSSAIPVTLLPAPDLVVDSVVAPLVAEEGTLVDISWTVSNQGLGAAENGWIDRVYLQQAGNPNAELIELGRFEFRDEVPAGQFYTRNEAIRIPIQTAGVFNLYVDTNFGDALFEGAGADNNLTAAANPITLNVKPRPDLQVESIEIPDRIAAGATLSPQFVITNQGAVATSGQWVDRVYLSLDTTIDHADILIGQLPNSAACCPVSGTARKPVPWSYRFAIAAMCMCWFTPMRETTSPSGPTTRTTSPGSRSSSNPNRWRTWWSATWWRRPRRSPVQRCRSVIRSPISVRGRPTARPGRRTSGSPATRIGRTPVRAISWSVR